MTAVASHRIAAGDLTALVARVLVSLGTPDDEATIVAEHLVGANLRGHDSHGVGMMPTYINGIRAGGIKPGTKPKRLVDAGALALYDAERGFGHVAARIVTDDAIARARTHGVGLVGLKNSSHVARIGSYGEQVAAAGLAGMFFVNSVGRPPVVAPFGSAEARWSTNPICVAMPDLPGRPQLILDFATSAIAIGKARVAFNNGVPLAPGLLLDDQGHATTDPRYALQPPLGAFLPMGLHKGSGLALMCDLICGALVAGDHTAQPGHPYAEAMTNNLLAIVFDPQRFGDPAQQRAEMEAMVDYVKSARPLPPNDAVRVPGDVESETMARRLRDGIDVDPVTWKVLAELSDATP